MKLSHISMYRAAVISPEVKVADVQYNLQKHIELMQSALENSAQFIVFPELSITGYSCGDLFFQNVILDAAEKALCELALHVPDGIVVIAGAPIRKDARLYNCAIVMEGGVIHHIVPKTYLPNYAEFYEQRWFASSAENTVEYGTVSLVDAKGFVQECGFGANVIFAAGNVKFGVELCEDLWTVQPPSNQLALNGASIIANLSASNETVGKAAYRRELLAKHSATTMSAYCYANAGASESTTDTVFSGHSVIAENGKILSESKRLQLHSQITFADIDIELLQHERLKTGTFHANKTISYDIVELPSFKEVDLDNMERKYPKFPFIPEDNSLLSQRCEEIIAIQSTALAVRLKHIGINSVVVGLSGGLDSTLALIACLETFDALSLDRKNIIAITMPGLGTSSRTKNNAIDLAKASGITLHTIPIQDSVIQHFKDINHNAEDHSLVFENAQARERTQILMDMSNKHNAIVIGTGDMSELALGWCTYNGDHMSMYGINAGIPKTLVKALVEWYSSTPRALSMQKLLLDIVATPVSPELLPLKEGEMHHKTEDLIGPYMLHDFFLYYMLRHGFSPKKIALIARNTFIGEYSLKEILQWMRVFYRRFFTQQFKRSSMPDGPKIGSIALSPRADWRMPSDAHATLWLHELEELESMQG